MGAWYVYWQCHVSVNQCYKLTDKLVSATTVVGLVTADLLVICTLEAPCG